jgi:hypothetical protein
MHPSGPSSDDAVRLALAMVRAEWQDDPEAWNQLYAVCDDPAELARQLTHLCRLIPHPEPGHVTMVDLRKRDAGT